MTTEMTLPGWAHTGHLEWRKGAERRAIARGMKTRLSRPVEQWHEGESAGGLAAVVPRDAIREGLDIESFRDGCSQQMS